MPDATVNIELYCSCGEGICGNATFSIHRREPTFTIEPCDKCLQVAFDEGHEQGLAEGEAIK